jgi:GNAT superfamily N-acetyltransferase
MIEYRDTPGEVDLPQLASLFESVGWHKIASDPERLARMVRGSMYAVWGLNNERLVGAAQAISDGAFYAYVSSVVVHPEYQRRGIGREMVRRLLDGRPHVTFVLHAHPPLQPFYLRDGFRSAPDMMRRDRSH